MAEGCTDIIGRVLPPQMMLMYLDLLQTQSPSTDMYLGAMEEILRLGVTPQVPPTKSRAAYETCFQRVAPVQGATRPPRLWIDGTGSIWTGLIRLCIFSMPIPTSINQNTTSNPYPN